MDFSYSNVDSIPGNFQIRVHSVRIVAVLLDILSFKKKKKKTPKSILRCVKDELSTRLISVYVSGYWC